MVVLAGNFICKTSFALQCRALLIPWVKKSNCISCSKVRACSSFPVRYIPKTSSKTKEQQTFMPIRGLEDKELRDSLNPNVLRVDSSGSKKSSKTKEQQTSMPIKGSEDKELCDSLNPNVLRVDSSGSKKYSKTKEQQTFMPIKGSEDKELCDSLNPNVLRVDSSGSKNSQRSFALDEKSQNQNRIQNHKHINYLTFDAKPEAEEEISHYLGVVEPEFMEEPEETKQDTEKLAIELLAARAFTAVELRKKLLGQKFPPDIVDAVIVDFQSRGLINDCLYAETFSRSRFSSLSWGPRRIKQALFKKGISEVDAEKAIKLVFDDGDSGGDQESRLGLSKLSMDHLFVQASKHWLRGRPVPTETRKLRIIWWLQYRGFSWGVIDFILKKLESEYSP
ncbi:hypothetical protein F0562_009948 [Nyssa sinensis]|uniref:Regulatory protein RecX n=1 Tax=Nyssa sinensis TaxID=561372 RepID=A0A5J4ZXI7_9ASTE|nr:hypothetical protein F0562_009948 [Nyssa sinensis]